MAKKQSVHTPDSKLYLLKGIPPELWRQAQAKAASQRPPLSMRWAILLLLEAWISDTPGIQAGKRPSPRSIF